MGKIGKGGFLSNFTSNVGKLKNIRTTAGGVIDKLPRGGRLDALRLRGMYGMEKVGGSLARIGGGSTTAGAATVAGTAVAGYLAGGLVSDKLFNANTKLSRAGGAAAGAGTGAAVGATIGSVIPGLGTAAGAIIGGIAGAIGGWVKAGKERRKFDNIAKNTLEEYGKSMDKAIESGDIESLKKAAKKANEDYYALLAEGKYGTQAFKARKDELDALNKQTKTTQKNFSNFETFFGDPDKLIEALGPDAVEKAKNGIIDIFQVMRDGGVDVQATWRAVMGDFNQQLLDQRLAMFDNAIQAIETSEAVNAAQQKILEGDTSEKSVIDFLKKSYEYALDKTGGDAVAATALLDKSLSKAYGRGGALEKVADVVKLQADKLKLFDPQVLLDQVMQTGKLEAQGRAIESMTGGQVNAGEATLRLMQLYATGGATSGKQIDQLMLGALSNKITKAQLMSGLFGEGQLGTFSKLANKPAGMSGERSAAEDEFIRNRNRATGGMVAPDAQRVNVGGVTIPVSGFIKDTSVAKMIAEEVQKATAQYIARAGAGSTAPPAKRE